MEYLFGQTFTVKTPNGDRWEKYEIKLDLSDLAEMAKEVEIAVEDIPPTMRYLLLKMKGQEIEAAELSTRKYIEPTDAKYRIAAARTRIESVWADVRTHLMSQPPAKLHTPAYANAAANPDA